MIDQTREHIRNKIEKTMDFTNESSTPTYLESHKQLVKLYLNYLLRKYPTEREEQA